MRLRSTIEIMPGLVVRPRARILHGHDWVYASEVLKVFGRSRRRRRYLVSKDGRDRVARLQRYSTPSRKSSPDAFRRRRQESRLSILFPPGRAGDRLASADRLRPESYAALIWSEGRWTALELSRTAIADVIVLQTLTLGMDRHKPLLVESLIQAERRSACRLSGTMCRSGRAEGLPLVSGVHLSEGILDEREIDVHGVRFLVDFLHGQKTGLYLDQIGKLLRSLRNYARGRRVAGLLCQPGWVCAGLRAHDGALEVTAVESAGRERARSCARTAAAKWIARLCCRGRRLLLS